jgi:hypothetical protein
MKVTAARNFMIVAAVAFFVGVVRSADAQLRPLEQSEWKLFEDGRSFSARMGGSRLLEQKASLAGTTGDMWEAGIFSLSYRTGRVIVEASGTAQRFFRETGRFDDPYTDVEPTSDGHRHDSGDYRVSTSIRFTPDRSRVRGALRFGTRLPTTDNTTGLERDAVDFFATLGASGAAGALSVSGETGLGIQTTRENRFEQDDLLLYSLRAEIRRFVIVPSVEVIGQRHGTGHSEIRGVEDLGEFRLGARIGSRDWLRVEFVKGYETFSPGSGVVVTAGLLR